MMGTPFLPTGTGRRVGLIVLLDSSLKESNNWRSQSKTSHKPTRPMTKRLNSTRKELQAVKRGLGRTT